MTFLFIGEQRSQRAIDNGWTWEDGRLAAKPLFDALKAININPEECRFMNWFESENPLEELEKLSNQGFEIVSLGAKVHDELTKRNVNHIAVIHPAARGKIRLKANYFQHIKERLSSVQ
jgi:hypothetical protein